MFKKTPCSELFENVELMYQTLIEKHLVRPMHQEV